MLLFAGLSASAAYRSVVVHRHDGTCVKISIDEAVKANIADGPLVFSSSKGFVSLPVSEVWHWAFSSETVSDDVWSGVGSVAVDTVEIMCGSGSVDVLNLPPGGAVSLHALDGTMVAVATADADGSCSIDSSSLTKGIYMLTYGNHSIKILLGR